MLLDALHRVFQLGLVRVQDISFRRTLHYLTFQEDDSFCILDTVSEADGTVLSIDHLHSSRHVGPTAHHHAGSHDIAINIQTRQINIKQGPVQSRAFGQLSG